MGAEVGSDLDQALDWAEGHHDVTIIDSSSKQLAKCRINNDLDGYEVLLDLLAEHSDTVEGLRQRRRQGTSRPARAAEGAVSTASRLPPGSGPAAEAPCAAVPRCGR
ncbi:transposase [Streptomyces globisporus]|uniref:IS110 family transposase n=1 Tax=Streptomyces globisporus TaxID=1908 RepID=UPI000D141747